MSDASIAAIPADGRGHAASCFPVNGNMCSACPPADGTLSDATDAVALAADECTVAAGCVGDLLVAQARTDCIAF